jgi:hypothetical protein
VSARARCCPRFTGRLRTQHGPTGFRPRLVADALRRSGPPRQRPIGRPGTARPMQAMSRPAGYVTVTCCPDRGPLQCATTPQVDLGIACSEKARTTSSIGPSSLPDLLLVLPVRASCQWVAGESTFLIHSSPWAAGLSLSCRLALSVVAWRAVTARLGLCQVHGFIPPGMIQHCGGDRCFGFA